MFVPTQITMHSLCVLRLLLELFIPRPCRHSDKNAFEIMVRDISRTCSIHQHKLDFLGYGLFFFPLLLYVIGLSFSPLQTANQEGLLSCSQTL